MTNSSKLEFISNGFDRPTKTLYPGLKRLTLTIVAATLFGCASFGGQPLVPGETETAVLAKLGRPTHVFQDGNVKILEYMTGPFGQTTHFARIDPEHRLISYEQVLTSQKFAQIDIGRATKADVLHLIGTPSETSYLDLPQLEVWSYPYWESPVSDSVMHVHFDRSGIVQKILNAPDLRRESDWGALNLHGKILSRMP